MSGQICIAHGGDVSYPSGGTDRVTALASGLENIGFDVTLVVLEPERKLPERLSNVNIEPVPFSGFGVKTQLQRAFRVSHRAKQIARKNGACLQFEHSTLAGFSTYLGQDDFVLDMHDLAFRSSLYSDLPLGNIIQILIRRIEGRALERASHIVVVSGTMKEIVVTRWGVPEERISVIPNGYFENKIDAFRSVEAKRGRVVFLGTFHPKLDVETLIAIAKLPEVDEMIVIGDGNKRYQLEKASQRIDSLRMTGRLPDKEAFQLVSESSVAVNPQHLSDLQKTSSPVKLAYYAALGVPSVVTEGPELARQLHDDGAALLVSAEENFPEKVRKVLVDDHLRGSMAENASKAAQELTWSQRTKTFANMYDQHIGGVLS